MKLSTTGPARAAVQVELLRGGRAAARAVLPQLDGRERTVVLSPRRGRLPDGRYTLLVRTRGLTLVDRRVRLG